MSTNATQKLSLVGLLLLIFGLGIYAGNTYFVFPPQEHSENPAQQSAPQNGTASITIDDGSTAPYHYTMEVMDGENMQSILTRAGQMHDFRISFRDYGPQVGTVLQSINSTGTSFENSEKHWQYWINDVYITTNPDKVTVFPGDHIELRFASQQPEI